MLLTRVVQIHEFHKATVRSMSHKARIYSSRHSSCPHHLLAETMPKKKKKVFHPLLLVPKCHLSFWSLWSSVMQTAWRHTVDRKLHLRRVRNAEGGQTGRTSSLNHHWTPLHYCKVSVSVLILIGQDFVKVWIPLAVQVCIYWCKPSIWVLIQFHLYPCYLDNTSWAVEREVWQ